MIRVCLIVDVQNDFLPGGSLAVPGGDKIIPVIQELAILPFHYIFATQDWHPPHHCSFASTHAAKVGDVITLKGKSQHLWPDHCVAGTKGAELAPGWKHPREDHLIKKGTDPNYDSYSTFFDNQRLHATPLYRILKALATDELYIAGLATDYCVLFSVLDACRLGWRPYVIVDGCCGINLHQGDVSCALEQMQKAGAHLTTLQEVKRRAKEERW